MRLEYFQLIDRIVELDLTGHKIRTEATVPASSTIFEGHFPGYPLMPGVLLVESMAQTSGWLMVAIHAFASMPFLAAVKEAKFRTFVTPEQRLSVTAHLTHDGSGYAMTEARISCEDKPVCEAALTFRVLDFPNEQMKQQMRDTAARLGLPTAKALANG